MRNSLADLVLEFESAIAFTLRLGRSIDEASSNEAVAALSRIGTAIGKYWICKRATGHAAEALERLGGMAISRS
mgnify:FL=1|jgi:putative acyl-CoA dehydrogenase